MVLFHPQTDGCPASKDECESCFGELGCPFTRQESKGVVADLLISLEMTRPQFLRAVQAGKVLSGFGRVLRLEPGQIGAKALKAEDVFKLSKEVKSIDVFWSHS